MAAKGKMLGREETMARIAELKDQIDRFQAGEDIPGFRMSSAASELLRHRRNMNRLNKDENASK